MNFDSLLNQAVSITAIGGQQISIVTFFINVVNIAVSTQMGIANVKIILLLHTDGMFFSFVELIASVQIFLIAIVTDLVNSVSSVGSH